MIDRFKEILCIILKNRKRLCLVMGKRKALSNFKEKKQRFK